jgi:hypothetical protein
MPWLGYFDKIDKSDCFVFLDKVQYKAREFQNRNKIRTKEGWMWLTVPVMTKGLRHQKIDEVKIDNTRDWERRHLRSLKIWYGNTEFFNDHIPFFEHVFAKQWERLIDLNIYIIDYLLQAFGIDTKTRRGSEIGTSSEATDRIIEICRKMSADTYLSGAGGKDYLEEGKFAQAGIKLEYQDFKHPVYWQRDMDNRNSFIPYMSAVDLLFNVGPKSGEILRGEREGIII